MDLFLAFLVLDAAALVLARSHLLLLLRRSRWLLLAMLLMFGWMTPGTPLPGLPGASKEGLLLAADSIERLLIALATVAMILTALRPVALVAGMRSLLAPLALLNISRDRIAVRLALTMQEVEASRKGRETEVRSSVDVLELPAIAPGWVDFFLATISIALVLAAWLT